MSLCTTKRPIYPSILLRAKESKMVSKVTYLIPGQMLMFFLNRSNWSLRSIQRRGMWSEQRTPRPIWRRCGQGQGKWEGRNTHLHSFQRTSRRELLLRHCLFDRRFSDSWSFFKPRACTLEPLILKRNSTWVRFLLYLSGFVGVWVFVDRVTSQLVALISAWYLTLKF